MHIQNRFEVPMAPPDAWIFLMNIPSTVPCFPGAKLVEKIDEDHYKGRMTVKLGPMSMVFVGKLRIEKRDEAAHSATVKANWTETKGRGNAVTVTRFAMQAHGSGTLVEVESDVQLAGQVAQYGRGAGMISEISAQLIAKFADNLRASIEAASAVPVGGGSKTRDEGGGTLPRDEGGGMRDEGAKTPMPTSNPLLPHKDISGLSLLWSSLMSRVKRLFN